ncbi:hypothetical protein BAY59_27200 [Prauserella coralliicola]|nr:hypothetical protein BAY59_27200 [Prauserella coralliicola]
MSTPRRMIVAGRAALDALRAGIARADADGVHVSVVVVDRAGRVVVSFRDEDALPVTPELALAKARAACSFARPSDALAGIVQPGQPFYGLPDALPAPIATFAGGLPLTEDGRCYGAVGVSGGSAAQDVAYVRAVVEELSSDCAPGEGVS